MNKKVIIPILVILVIVVAALAVKKKGGVISPDSNGSIEKQSAEDKAKSTLQSMLGAGKQVKCEWKQASEGMEAEGIVYVDNKKAKIEIKMKTSDQNANDQIPEIKVHTYTDGEWTYSWGGFSGQGMKFKNEEMEKEAAEAAKANDDTKKEIAASWNQEFEYNCSPWKVDNSIFQLPSDIEFKNLDEEMKELKENMGDMKEMCNSLPDPQKEECLKAFE